MQSQTIKSDPIETARADADETPNTYGPRAPRLSPLARAALENGVSFADVLAYCESRSKSNCPAVQDEAQDIALDSALERSHALVTSKRPRDTLPASRPWWH